MYVKEDLHCKECGSGGPFAATTLLDIRIGADGAITTPDSGEFDSSGEDWAAAIKCLRCGEKLDIAVKIHYGERSKEDY